MTKEGSATAKSGHRPPLRVWGVLLVLGIVLLAANLRPALTGLTPLVGQIRVDTSISYGVAGLLTALPLLAMGALSPIAPLLARRLGMERVLLVSMLVLAAGILLRSAGPVAAMFLGTIVLGAGIAIGNVLLPGLVKREFPERVGLMTSMYTTALAVSAAIAAGTSFPIADQAGIDWRGSLALWRSLRSWQPRLGCLRFGTLVARTPLPRSPRGLAARGARRSLGR